MMVRTKMRKWRKVQIIIVIVIAIMILIPYLHWYTHQNDPISLEKYSWKKYTSYFEPQLPKNGYLAFEKNFTLNTSMGEFTLFVSVLSWPFRENELDNGLKIGSCLFQFNMPIFITNESKNRTCDVGANYLILKSANPNLSIKRVYFMSGACYSNSLLVFPLINISKGYTGAFNTTSGWNSFFSNFELSFNFDKIIYNGYFYYYANEGRYSINL